MILAIQKHKIVRFLFGLQVKLRLGLMLSNWKLLVRGLSRARQCLGQFS